MIADVTFITVPLSSFIAVTDPDTGYDIYMPPVFPYVINIAYILSLATGMDFAVLTPVVPLLITFR